MTPLIHPTNFQHVYDISTLPETVKGLKVIYDGLLFLIEKIVIGKYYIMASAKSPQEVVVLERTDYETFNEIYRSVLNGGNAPLQKAKTITGAIEKILERELNLIDRHFVIIQSKLNDN